MKLLIENWRTYLNEDIEKTLREWELLVHDIWETNNSGGQASMDQYDRLEGLEALLRRPNGPYDPQELLQMKDKAEREGTSIPPAADVSAAGTVDLRGTEVTPTSIAGLKKRMKQRSGEEQVDVGVVDPRTGKVRVK